MKIQERQKVFAVTDGTVLEIHSDLTANNSDNVIVTKIGGGTMLLDGRAWNVVEAVSTEVSLD